MEDEDDDDEDMVDLSRMLEAGSADESDEQGSSSDADDDSASADGSREDRLAELIDSLAQPAKRRAEEGDEVDAEGGAPAAKRSRRVLSERTEAVPEGEFAAPGRGSAGLRVEDLLSPLSGQAGLSGVRNSARILADARPGRGDGQQPLASKRGGGALSAPLPTIVQDRLDRAAAYEQTRAEVEGWAPTIKRVREAEHLSFPLQQTKEAAPSNAALTANFAPSNEFENTIAGLLQAGGMTEKQLAQQEDLAMKDLSPEEVAQRRAELRRMRELMFRAEQKAKRVNKIKSKTYRKIKRRERERAQDILAGPSDEQDHEDPEDRLKAEQARARERATLKHKNTGKWARGVMGRREQDVDGRMAIEEQLQRGEQLRRKIQGLGSGDESEPDDYSDLDDNAEEDEEGIRAGAFDELRALEQREAAQAEADEEAALKAGGKKGVYNMKFMKDAREREARKANGMVDDFVAELDGLGEDEEDDEKDAQKARVIRLQGNAGRAFYGTGSIQVSFLPRFVC